MKNIYLFSVITGLALVFAGCEKDNDPPSNSELIVGKDWKIISYFISENTTPPYDVFTSPNVTVCTKDDLYKFSTDGKYIIDEGATKCYQNDPQIYQEGTWTISENTLNRTYAVTGGAFTETYNILELTQNQMVLERTYTDRSYTYTFKITYITQ